MDTLNKQQELSYRKQIIISCAHKYCPGHLRDLEIYIKGHSR